MMTTKADTYGNIQDFSEYVEEIRDINTKIEPPKTIITYFHAFVVPPRGMVIFKRMVIILRICLLKYFFVQCFLEHNSLKRSKV